VKKGKPIRMAFELEVSVSVFSVKDYGACGNGSANDTTAIQAAIDAASAVRGTVFFPGNSSYLVSRSASQGTEEGRRRRTASSCPERASQFCVFIWSRTATFCE